ncbi:uncharacterized protein RCO7_01468 [Rhynchosporium graminicola]|uniref:Yeast cell wall synthesis Kre9/Knh1-like N-terminal domain-containing protein n=1 Tax=Rhynchosporium graminicola TaxID=2792576 RepID=A0A1E1JZL6_9HELO|nr:uncharacterized protein RCO7_01468 [Rhynchosporium commune]
MLPRSLLYMILAFTAPCIVTGIVTPTNAAADFQKIRVGAPFTISWSGATGDVTIALLLASGATVFTIGTAIAGNSYIWNPPALSRADKYILQFVDATLVKSESVSFDFREDPIPAARDATSLTSSTTRSTSLTKTNNRTSSTNVNPSPTMSSSLSSPTVESQQTSITANPVPTASQSSHHGGLSAGAKAGISVGVVLGVALIICLVLLAFWIGRRTALNSVMNDDRGTNDMEDHGGGRWYGGEKPKHDPGSAGSRHNLLKRTADGRNSRMGTMGTMTTDGMGRMGTMTTNAGSRMTFNDGRSSRMGTMTMTDGGDSRAEIITPTPMSPIIQSPLCMSPVDGKSSRLGVLSDGRTSRIGLFEFENSTDARGFAGGIRIVEMEDFKI